MNTRELRTNKQKLLTYALVLIPFIFFLYILIVPLGTSIYYSLCKWKGVGAPNFIWFDNYAKLWKDKNFWLVVKNTLRYSLYCTLGQVGLALLVSLLLTGKQLRLKAFHRAVIFFPVVMAPVVVGFVWKIIYNTNYGVLNTILRSLNLDGWIKPWLDDPNIIIYTVSVPVIWQYIGLYMVILLSAITSIPNEIYECAELDGADGIKRSWYITLPMIWDTLKIVIILVASGTMKIYDHIYVISGGGPGRSSMSMAVYAYQNTFVFGNFGYGSAIAVVILAIALLIGLLVQAIMGRKSA